MHFPNAGREYIKDNFEQGGIVPVTAGTIASADERIASPVAGICPRSETLKFYVNCVSCNLLAWNKLLAWKMR